MYVCSFNPYIIDLIIYFFSTTGGNLQKFSIQTLTPYTCIWKCFKSLKCCWSLFYNFDWSVAWTGSGWIAKNKNVFFCNSFEPFFSSKAIYDINIIISIFFAISSVSRLKSANLNWNIVCEACKKTRSKENWVCSLSKDLNSLTFLKSILTLQFDATFIFQLLFLSMIHNFETFWLDRILTISVWPLLAAPWIEVTLRLGSLGLSVQGVNISIISVCPSASAK